MAQIDWARYSSERDIVKPVMKAPGSNAVEDGAAGLGGDIDDGALCDRATEPFVARRNVLSQIQEKETLATTWFAKTEAHLVSLDQTLDQRPPI